MTLENIIKDKEKYPWLTMPATIFEYRAASRLAGQYGLNCPDCDRDADQMGPPIAVWAPYRRDIWHTNYRKMPIHEGFAAIRFCECGAVVQWAAPL